MRTRRARLVGARPHIESRHEVTQVHEPFKMRQVSASSLGSVIEDYVLQRGAGGMKVSGELLFEPSTQQHSDNRKHLSLDTSWQLKLHQAIEISEEESEEAAIKQDRLNHAIEKYSAHMKRNLVKNAARG